MREYELHPEAYIDLHEIGQYIADYSPDAPDEKPLWVVAIFHGYRSPRVMAAILRGREDKPGKFT